MSEIEFDLNDTQALILRVLVLSVKRSVATVVLAVVFSEIWCLKYEGPN